MKKSLLVLVAFMLAPFVASAQSPVEREIEQMGLKGVSFKIASPSKQAPKAAAADEPKIELDFTHKDVSIVPNTVYDTNVMVTGHITNLTDQPLRLGFVRVQNLPPMWKTSVCFGQNCYVDWVSAVDTSQEPWAPNEERELVLHIRTPPGAQGSGNVELAFFPSYTKDTIKVTYAITMQPVPVTTCRTFWFQNPYDAETTLLSFGIDHPELFDIEFLSDTTYPTSPGQPFQVRFCLKKTDAPSYSTKITFVTDQGTFEQDITMATPTAGVQPGSPATRDIRIMSVSPNPASSSQNVVVNLESGRSANLSFSVVDLLGRELRTMNGLTTEGSSSVQLGLTDLSIGSYILLVKENGVVLDQTSFNIAR
jgi:hypothetical protein